MEDNKTSEVEVKQRMETPQRVVLTYYEGDINTVVDEHFFRALNKTSELKDLSTRPKDNHRTTRSVPTTSAWSSSWYKGSANLSHSSSSEEQVQRQEMIMGSPSLATAPWIFPAREGSSYEHPPLLYHHPDMPQSNTTSYLHLLHVDRSAGGVVIAPSSDREPEWEVRNDYRNIQGSRISLDSGVQMPEKHKDLYWY